MKRLHVFVAGNVQGVYFRESTRREAQKHDVSGWVRNLPDGRVEAVLEGSAVAVAIVAAWCKVGPERAAVQHVEALDEPATGEFTGFDVVR